MADYTPDDLPEEAHKRWLEIEALRRREKALEHGGVNLGDPVDGIDDCAEWVQWLEPDEVWMLYGLLARGVFVHINGGYLNIKIGAAKAGRKKADRELDAVLCHFGQGLGAAAVSTVSAKTMRLALQRIGALRKELAEAKSGASDG